MIDNRDESYVSSSKLAILGASNGIVAYDLIWPFLVVGIMKLILQDNYSTLLNNNYYLVSALVSLFISLVTITASVFIAGHTRIIKAFHLPNKKDLKVIIYTLLAMFAFSYIYNIILVMLNLNVSDGNTNQQLVNEMILGIPILAFVIMIIVAPLNEEITYRYFIFGGLRKINRKLAIVVSGFVFMLAHAMAGLLSKDANILNELIQLPPYLFSGMALAYANDKTSNLGVSLSIHVLNNLISFILFLLLV